MTDVQQASYVFANAVVNRQAGMLAYNDISWFGGAPSLFTMSIVFLLPGHASHSRASSAGS